MIKLLGAACVLAAISASSALAQSACPPPPLAPAAVNGTTASEKKMDAATEDVKEFLRQSSDYQGCLVNDLHAQQAAAAKNKKTFDESIADEIQARIDANQRERVRVGDELNAAVMQFCVANPKSTGCDKVLKGPH
jgi:hypothetical protein